MDRLQQRLQPVFGFTEFRSGQREAIEAVLRGERLLLIQPTGWGKSLVYQMVALEVGLTLVFSPLRALMRDQVRQANERFGIQADTINSDISEEEQRAVLERAVLGDLQLLYIAPERLENTLWQEYLPRLPIKAVVVDEAHCVSVWGHDFRPEYRRIVNLLKLLPPDTPALAVTATATKRVEEDIRRQFGELIPTTLSFVRNYYPALNDEQLLILSEVHPKAPWNGSFAMMRNRIVAGLADFVLIAETGPKQTLVNGKTRLSGTWNCAETAHRMGVPVFVFDLPIEGNQKLLAEGLAQVWSDTTEPSKPIPLTQQASLFSE